MYLNSHQIHLHTCETVVQEYEKFSLLQDRDFFGRSNRPLEHCMEEPGELVRSVLERCPGRNSLTELLIHNNDDRHDVCQGRGFSLEVRPEIVLQELRELEHHNPLDCEPGALDVVFINLFNHVGVIINMVLGGMRSPVRFRQSCQIIRLIIQR